MRMYDNYGCVNYLPLHYPEGESKTSQEKKKKDFQEQYSLGEAEVDQLMIDTYYTQREDIVEKKTDIPTLQVEWPYLFEQAGMFVHFKELTGINFKDTIVSTI